MTQHDPKDVEAAIELLRKAINEPNSYETETSLNLMRKALAKLKPKTEKVYVLPKIKGMSRDVYDWFNNSAVSSAEWNKLRELTAIEPQTHEAVRKIMGMNK